MYDSPYRLPDRQRAAVRAIGRAAIPRGRHVPAYDDASVGRLEDGLGWMDPAIRRGYLALVSLVGHRLGQLQVAPWSRKSRFL